MARAYLAAVLAAGLNVPILAALLASDLMSVDPISIAGLYAGLVVVGYYGLVFLFLVSGLFALLSVWPRVAIAASGLFSAVALYYLAVDGVVYHVFRFHVDAFWLQYLMTSFNGLGLPPSTIALAAIVFLACVGLEIAIFRLAVRASVRTISAVQIVALLLVSFLLSQAIHIVAYYRSDARITAITPLLPFYYPVRSHREAMRYAGIVPFITESGGGAASGPEPSLHYPLRQVPMIPPSGFRTSNVLVIMLESWRWDTMNAAVSPVMDSLGQRSSVFLRHFSTGNATPTGIFGFFYGIHPTNWEAVKANSAAIHNPVLIDALEANHYSFGIFAASQFDRHRIKATVFNGIDVHEAFSGATWDERDRDMTNQLLTFMADQQRQKRRFFAYAFYKSTHYPYVYPKDRACFQPSRELNVAMVGRGDTQPYMNDYHNAVHYVDELVSQIVRTCEATGLLKETIIVITSDHGEEFDDNGAGYWGHCGNYTQYQTRVPMIVYVPGRKPERVSTTTSHVDVVPTLMQEALGVGQDVADYSDGVDMFGRLPKERPLVLSSYVNHAFILGDDVYEVYPVYVRSYQLTNARGREGARSASLMRQALEETQHFQPRVPAGAATGAIAGLAGGGGPAREPPTRVLPRHPNPPGLLSARLLAGGRAFLTKLIVVPRSRWEAVIFRLAGC
jgi:hypothetical protein